MTAYVWFPSKSGWVLYAKDVAVGVVFRPRSGSWYSWNLIKASNPYADDTSGRVRGKQTAMDALVKRWEKEAQS